MGDWGAKKRERKSIAKNRRAFHEYEILETFEAGLELTGTEVRSLRENNCQLTDCFALIRGGEVWLHNVHIAPYSNGNIANVDPDRKRKLLLHRREIRLLEQKTREKGLTLVPVSMYFKENSARERSSWRLRVARRSTTSANRLPNATASATSTAP